MPAPHAYNITRLEFIEKNPHLTISEMANKLGISQSQVRGLCTRYDLDFAVIAVEKAGKRKGNGSTLNVFERENWLI